MRRAISTASSAANRCCISLPKRDAGSSMKALFLGNVAADTANGIRAELIPELQVDIIAGAGRVGQEVARRAAVFGCSVLAANRSPRAAGDGVERVYPLDALDEMLPLCDTVAICTAFGPETERLIDARRLTLIKPSA